MSNTISSTAPQPQQVKEPKFKNKGFIRGYMAASLATTPLGLAGFSLLGNAQKLSKLSKKDSIDLSKATQEALKQTGLYDKGVRVYKVKTIPLFETIKEIRKNPENQNVFQMLTDLFKPNRADFKAQNAITTEILSSTKFKKRMKFFTEKLGLNEKDIMTGARNRLMQPFKLGMNAAFLPNANKIITPDKKLQTSVFHEIGHAMNYNGGGILKCLQKCRGTAMMIPGAILLISLLNKRKTTDPKLENNSIKNRIQNTFDSIKRNAATLTGLSMAPILLEEGIASLRGGKLAKNLCKQGKLSKNILKKVNKTNLIGFATYALGLAASMLATKVAINVKDKIQGNYEAKKIAKYNKKMAKIQEAA